MSPSWRVPALVAVAGLAVLWLPLWVAVAALIVLAAVLAVDAFSVRHAPGLRRELPTTASRGVPAALSIEIADAGRGRGEVRVRQPAPPDLAVEPPDGVGGLAATVLPRRRGDHELGPPVLRSTGPLRLARWDHEVPGTAHLRVYPDLRAARRLAHAVRTGRQRDTGARVRGPLGLGTDFETVREYQPDDDVRRINWVATARLERPMSNQYRLDTERDVLCVVDTGRLMLAPLGDGTRLDVALDAVVAVAAVADVVGDRCGVLAFDAAVRRHLRPQHRGGRGVAEAVYDLEPTAVDSDYEAAFARAARAKRALVVVLTDLLDEAAARPLVAAMPTLTRRHAVVVATPTDTDLDAIVTRMPAAPNDVYQVAVARDLLEARDRAAARLRHVGATVVEAPAHALGDVCVRAYLRQKARARL